MRKADQDTRNATYQAMNGKFTSVFVALRAATSFDTPEIMAISDEKLDVFYAEKPELERYRRYLTDLRRMKAHTLSAAEEKLLAAAGEMSESPDKIFGVFSNADLTFPDAVDSKGEHYALTQGTFVALEKNRHPEAQEQYVSVQAKNVVFYAAPMTLQEERIMITGANGTLTVENVSGEDITGDIYIYYKNSATDLFYGGITYRVCVSGGLASGEKNTVIAGHYTVDGSRLLLVECGD